MRIHVHDGSGHPFQVQLSRELARRGHEVLHAHAAQWVSGHGRLTVTEDDPPTLRIVAIRAERAYDKYSPRRRIAWELAYARAWIRVLAENPTDVVVSCNTQLITAAVMGRHFRRTGQRWVLWHQDIASLAVADELRRKLPGPVAGPAAAAAVSAERRLVRDSSAVVAIGQPFADQYGEWGITPRRLAVIGNWAPIDEIVPLPRGEGWAEAAGIPPAQFRLLYAGTLGRKHNPMLLADLRRACAGLGVETQLVVASEGPGADDLVEAARGDDGIRVVGFQSADALPAMLSSADVLVALLEPEASRFSIPSKIFSYLAAGRPVLAMIPGSNPAADDVRLAGGMVVSPDAQGIGDAARWLTGVMSEPAGRASAGAAARAHAEARFDVKVIADRFESLLTTVTAS